MKQEAKKIFTTRDWKQKEVFRNKDDGSFYYCLKEREGQSHL
jgi:hypothetical protein